MFAKPAPVKKASCPTTKQKVASKPKTVSVKTGIKAPAGKKIKPDVRKSLKPPPRQDAGYCLYSSDTEDEVGLAFNEMEACEKILTQLKHKQKGGDSAKKTKGKKKKDKSPLPKALNENTTRADIVPGFSSIYGTTYPYGTALFLRQLQSQDLANNPMFNSRLASSTPDPDKHLADLSAAGKLSTNADPIREIPERDISTVSSVGPSNNHVQNMADMIEMYKRLEYNKATQLHEAMARAELEKFKEFQSASVKHTESVEGSGVHVVNTDNTLQPVNNSDGTAGRVSDGFVGSDRVSDGFVGSGSLGFHVPQGQYIFQPVNPGDSITGDHDGVGNQDSSLTAFQPYLSHNSKEMLPPQSWVNLEGQQGQSQFQIDLQEQGQMNSNTYIPHNANGGKVTDYDIPNSGRTDFSGASKGTDYVMLARRTEVNEGQNPTNEITQNTKVSFEKQNGLYQIHQNGPVDNQNSSCESKSDRSGSGVNKGQGSLDEVPERDLPVSKTPPSSARTISLKEGTVETDNPKNESQNLSELTTPRNQNQSGSGSTSSYGGRIVFIPNDCNTQNVIGYVPGITMIPGTNQPISLSGTNEAQLAGNSVLSSVTGQGQISQGQISQVTSQGQTEGVSYHSVLAAKTIAAGDIGVRKLRYLLKEMKECTRVSKDVEVTRLVTEIDETIHAIPQLALTFNLQTEIDLAIQPLRSENSQLRRKLRLLNQHLKEKDLAVNDEPKDINFEILHLQTSNTTLQKVLKEEREIKTRLAAEVQYLYNEIHKMKVEKSRLIAETSEKETGQLKIRQEMTLELQKLKHDLDLAKKGEDVTLTRVESIEKENHILQITLKERDNEITRQSEIVELMKDSIGELLGELEQSRVGEVTWDHNNSYGLHRLMKIVEEEGTGFPKEQARLKQARTPERRVRTPERQAFDFNQSDSSTSTAQLTRAALAYHDRQHRVISGGRLCPDGRQGPASESELDTLVELQGRNKIQTSHGVMGKPGRRRTSSSSPVRLRSEPLSNNFLYQRSSTSPETRKPRGRDSGGQIQTDFRSRFGPQRETTIGQDNKPDLSPSRKQTSDRRVPIGRENTSPKRRAPEYNSKNRCFDRADPSEVSVEQSRYSVTDYFQKYHPQEMPVRSSEHQSERSRPPRGQTQRDIQSRLVSQFQTSSEIDDRTVKSSQATGVNLRSNQRKFFKGLSDEQTTISAIHDDDNVSSVSMSSVTTANTVDDRKFRRGIATLDANIAKLQQALQKTKSLLT